MTASLDSVPDEIIRQILQHVAPDDAFDTLPLVSKRLQRLSVEPLLWKHYCQISYSFWDPQHRFDQKLGDLASKTPWRALWRRRKYRNDLIARLLDEIIATKVSRLAKIGDICQFGYDAKDFLLDQIRTPDSAEDALARR